MVLRRRAGLWWAGAAALAASALALAFIADFDTIGSTLSAARADAPGALLALAAYGLAFALRALAWTRVLRSLSFRHALAALHVSLAGNHVLPLRLGETLRVTDVVSRARVPLAPAVASTVAMRAADVVAVVAIAAALGPRFTGEVLGRWGWAVVVPGGLLWLGGIVWLRRIGRRSGEAIRTSSFVVALSALGGWVLESAILFEAATWAGISISFADAVLVTAVTIAAQVVAIAPAGLGTYEAAATAALVGLGGEPGAALAAALTAHALKTAYALVTGAVALFVPSPGALGRFRLSRREPEPPRAHIPDGPIVMFSPAHNEEETVAAVVTRIPSVIAGRPVVRVVVDDGSTDRTAAHARGAGAEVVSVPANMGLGAAVRVGLRDAVARGAAAVAFCDADGEYAPEELERMIEPILAGRADYVVGSRFHGEIVRMLPHRRIGNAVLTSALAFVARRPLSDGQSGFRALSRAAAAAAEIIHDYNYAQVLTLDLTAKGFRYAEVPISYSWRSTGRSFVRVGRYLRRVIPAVHRELNVQQPDVPRSGDGASVFDARSGAFEARALVSSTRGSLPHDPRAGHPSS
jgi:uncharacterized membrane protein YbhN (UPF0104 family)